MRLLNGLIKDFSTDSRNIPGKKGGYSETQLIRELFSLDYFVGQQTSIEDFF
jgi:hypothetical protein